jgi:hypothetical protein
MSPSRTRVPAGRHRAAQPRRTRPARAGAQAPTDAELVLGSDEASLLDVVDNVLSKGVVLTGELTISLAHVDLVYARLSLLLCAADRVMPGESENPLTRRSARHAARERVKRARRRG